MNNDTKPKGKKGKKVGEAKKDVAISASELVVGAETNEFTADARSSIFGNDPTTSGPAAVELLEESEVRIGDRLLSRVEVDKMDKVIADATASAEKEIELRVPKSDPLKQVCRMILKKALATMALHFLIQFLNYYLLSVTLRSINTTIFIFIK